MSYLRKKGEGRPISLTSQEISITMWCISLLFAAILVYMLGIRMIDPSTGEMFYVYDGATLGFILFMILFFSFFGIVWMNWGHSKWGLNSWTDRISHDWQSTIRIDKTGIVTNQVMKKDSLGYTKGIAFGKKAGTINKGGFKLTHPNGNPVLLVVDFMSRNVNISEAIGWRLYKRKHGIIGYDSYIKCKREKKTLLTYDGKSKIEKEPKVIGTVKQSEQDKQLIPVSEQHRPVKKKRGFFRRKRHAKA